MSSNHCLNCGSPLVGEYCHKCGQPATTHRLSLKHFVMHDTVHGMWHVDKGILYTLKNIFTRPGAFVREYIDGKRTGHSNVVTLLLLVVGLFLYTSGFYTEGMADTDEQMATIKNDRTRLIMEFVVHNFKWLMLGLIPMFSVGSTLMFRRRKYYYTEHLVINGYIFAGFLAVLIALGYLFAIPFMEAAEEENVEIYVAFFFLFLGYWQVWKEDYSFGGWLWRLLASFVIMSLVILLLCVIAVYCSRILYPNKL